MNSLGLDKPLFEKEKPTKKPVKSKKRKEPQQSEDGTTDEENDEKPAAKIQRFEAVSSATDSNVRRSSRNAGKVVDYKKEIQRGSLVPIAYSSGVKTAGNEGPMGREGGSRRIHNPLVAIDWLSIHPTHEIYLLGKPLVQSLVLLWGRGGKQDKAVVMMLYMRMCYGPLRVQAHNVNSLDLGSEVFRVEVKAHIVLSSAEVTKMMWI